MQVSNNRSNPKSSSGQTITARLEASISEASRRKRSACAWRLEAKIKRDLFGPVLGRFGDLISFIWDIYIYM